ISGGVPERMLRTAMEQGRAPLAGWRLDKDGVRRFARGDMTALHGHDREIVGFSVVFLPTVVGPSSERRTKEGRSANLADQVDPETFAKMFSGLDERYYVLDDEFNFVYVNQVAADNWQMDRADIIGRPIL